MITDRLIPMGSKSFTHRVYLRGGLGNILFQLAMARMVSLKNGGKVEVVDRFTNATSDNGSVEAMLFLCKQFDFKIASGSLRWHSIELVRQLFVGRRILLETNYQRRMSALASKGKPWAISGYFKNYGSLQDAVDEVALHMRHFLQIKPLNLGEEFIGLHIRLGDYGKFESIYGKLPAGYYQSAIHEIRDEHCASPLLIKLVSNDRKGALDFAVSFLDPAEFELAPARNTSIDDLRLLAQASFIVAPNSTFSWWAAQIGGAKKIFIPHPFLLDAKKDSRIDLGARNSQFLSRDSRGWAEQ